MDRPPPILDYGIANAVPQGLTIEPIPGGLRITLPTPPNPIPGQVVEVISTGLVELSPYLMIGFFVLGIGATMHLVRFWAILLFRDIPWQLYGFVGICAVLAIVHIWTLVRDRRRPSAIELTADTLRIRCFDAAGEKLRKISLARSQIYDVKFVPHSGNLVIRCHTENMIECRPIADPIVLQWIADVLREALHLP